MKCIDCGEAMNMRSFQRYEGFYYGAMVCPKCGRKEIEGK